MQPKRMLKYVAALSVAALAFTACGGGDDAAGGSADGEMVNLPPFSLNGSSHVGVMPVRKKCRFMPGRVKPNDSPSGAFDRRETLPAACLNALSEPHRFGTVVAVKTGQIPSV